MRKLGISILLGIIAGMLDLIPMLLQNLDWHACASAFAQWVVLGVLINHIDWALNGWLKGLIVAELSTLPILILVSGEGFETMAIIAVMTAILGSLVGYFGSRYA